MTSQGWYELRVDMSDFKNQSRYAYYRIFSVGNKASGYLLTIGEYEGNAGTCNLKYFLIIYQTIRLLCISIFYDKDDYAKLFLKI